ncbi:MFS transporter, partial [Streptomyces sp. SID161]|uniref:MFS transporter n=2 Tax=unclassified Streptomyces TaxID=2593676 RepID=UPI001367C66A|nr:MFS transporter [Streptomyces sp. SID161]
MKRLRGRLAGFDRPARLLMVNQFAINLGFYMLMPYLADHLAHGLGLAAWAVGLVLGVRNFSQQGMFLVGGTLADRYGCKPMILTGCALRSVAFGLLAVADSLPALVAASALTGLAGALFNPAVRAYLAADAGEERRVAAFAAFNVFYQAGILVGPLAGLALLAWDFGAVCAVAALIFAVLALLQSRALPARPPAGRGAEPAWRAVAADWRTIAANRPFLLFAAAMSGSYVLAFQVYLALPLHARELFGP